MKSIVVLFDEKNIYEDLKAFDGKSAKELCADAAATLDMPVKTIDGLSTISELVGKLASICSETESLPVQRTLSPSFGLKLKP